jgi:NAD-dependent dihydropyrimidine dehydrogenase PreA subunit
VTGSGATRGQTIDGLFIGVEVSPEVAGDTELARKLAEVCPVDIFAAHDGKVEIVEENLDECVLCELCLNASPAGAIKVVKLYSGESLPPA